MTTAPTPSLHPDPESTTTWAYQSKLPRLPIPPLEDTCGRYLRALEGLQDPKEHAKTKKAVDDFLNGEGPVIQAKLVEWAKKRDSYIEEFWYESYLSHSDPVVLALNPFFVLEDDPSPDRGAQLPRAASLIVASLGFIHDLRAGILNPDSVRGVPLDMDQYTRLLGTARIPTERGCKIQVTPESRHIVVLRHGQFYWFDVLDDENRPVLTERDVLHNLQAILKDADTLPKSEVARNSIGVLSTENRKVWSQLRQTLSSDRTNASCLHVVDTALFVVCLDDAAPHDLAELCDNFLCGTYEMIDGVQVGTCTNRWYDKLQIIVTADGQAGINFEHTGVDGHTNVPRIDLPTRFAADIFTECLMLLAKSINPSAPTLFRARLSPHAKSYKPPKGAPPRPPAPAHERVDSTPKKLEWALSRDLRGGIRFAETRLSDLICQNDCQALEFRGFGKAFITAHGFSPDAFVQMAFQAAYFGLYGRTECTYEPAMTKGFLHGRTEAIRTVQPESVDNCGNPALRLFGFGPVAADGYGIGYIIKEDGLSVCASSKHLQTRRFLDTLRGYLLDVQRTLQALMRAANARAEPFVDHGGVLRDSRTGRPISGVDVREDGDGDGDGDAGVLSGYSFFDSGDVEVLRRTRARSKHFNVGAFRFV
ncbi:Choline/Carnitine o-acyltransferase-domain-containing protein [Amylostereum chailletii]|nr:Choline/Carnitine o-acyltransferase-domain-containing protein [Amylostereum chailletii]